MIPLDDPWLRRIGQGICLAAGAFFLLFGVHLLVCAYQLTDPFSFVMTFFASNLIILISATIMVGLAIRLVNSFRKSKNNIIPDD